MDKAPKDLLETNGRAIKSAIAENYHVLGVLLVDSNRQPDAVEAFRQAIAIREKMPNKLATRNALAHDYFHLCKTLQKAGKLDEAAQACRRRVAILEAVTADFPEANQSPLRQALGWSYSDLAAISRAGGKHEDSAEAYGKAIAVFERLATDFPDRADYRQALDNNREKLAGLLKPMDKAPESNSK